MDGWDGMVCTSAQNFLIGGVQVLVYSHCVYPDVVCLIRFLFDALLL